MKIARDCGGSARVGAIVRLAAPMPVVAALLLSPTSAAGQADTLSAKVDAIFADVDRTNSPGCALGVIRDGRLIYARGYGMANLDDDVALSPASTFYIASTSKQFAAASILLLAQEGKLSLDDDVRKYVPELPNHGARVTISHLLHHTSGIRDYLDLMGLGAGRVENVMSEDDVIALIARQKALNFTPGAEYLYSNSGYFLLSVIVKRVTGTSLREYADQHIFKPLGMHDTHFHDDRLQVVKHRVIGYDPAAGGGFRIHYYANFEGVGDGGLWTTVEDLALWDQNFYHPTVGGPEFLAQLQTSGRLANGDTLSYASGLVRGRYRGLRTVSHGGAFMGYRAELLRFPEQRFSVVCLCNLSTTAPGALARKVADVYLAGELARAGATAVAAPGSSAVAGEQKPEILERIERASLTPAQLAEYAGEYYSDELRASHRLAVRGDTLLIEIPNRPKQALSPTIRDSFVLGGASLTFIRDAGRGVSAFVLRTPRVRNIRFERVRRSP